MRAASLSAIVVVACAAATHGQTVEFRVVERTGQTEASSADSVLDLAVQARFNGTNSLGGFYFDVRILGEAESRGTLARGTISNADGTYDPTLSFGSVVGRHGLARQYSYFANVNPNFNGLVNTSSGTFVNTPDQELGLVTSFVQGAPLLGTPGVDADTDGHPDTWSGNGTGATPANLTTAALNTTVASSYLGHGQFVDVYRFRYAVTDLGARTLRFRLQGVIAQQFTQLVYSGGQWGAQNTAVPSTAILSSGLDITVIPAPATLGVLGVGLLLISRRRR